jgi:ATP phosphoribosyltransferase
MQNEQRITIAIQKQGRLSNDSQALLRACGLMFKQIGNELISSCENSPVDILFIRDDDIPTLVQDGVCQLGIVGENVLIENSQLPQCAVLQRLGFGQCRLSIAVPNEFKFTDLSALNNTRIATSYPKILRNFCDQNQLKVEIVPMSGSVEVAPRLGMADAIFDLVSTGKTLRENGLREVKRVLESEALLITRQEQPRQKTGLIPQFQRLQEVFYEND